MSDKNEKIIAALATLDVNDDEHWTNDGLPAIAAVQKAADVGPLKRAEITAANPDFTRQSVIDAANKVEDEEPEADEADAEVPEAFKKVDEAEADDEAEQPAVTDQELDDMQAEIDALTAQHAAIAEQANSAQKAAMDLQRRRDELIAKQAKNLPPDHVKQQHDIADYLASQQRQREERAGLSQIDTSYAARRPTPRGL